MSIRVHSKSGKFIAILPDTLQGGFSVCATRNGVDNMRDAWPCSRLPNRAIRFCFASNGDLVDVSTGYDGEDLLALSQDAQTFGDACLERRRRQAETVKANERNLGDGI